MEYVKIMTSLIEVIEPLNDSERGRLFTALLEYAENEAKTTELKGNERYCWPLVKQTIDRERAKIEILRANGSRGGRPPKNHNKPNGSNGNQNKPDESITAYNNENDKENINIDVMTDDDSYRKVLRARARGTLSSAYPSGNIPEIWIVQLADAALSRELCPALLDEAIMQAAEHGAASPVAYAITVMDDMYQHNDKTRQDYTRRKTLAGYN